MTESNSPTNKNKTPAAPAKASKAARPAPAPQIKKSSKGSGKGFSVFALLLSLIALGGAGFTWYQTQVQSVQKNSSVAIGVAEIGGQVSRLGDSISRLQAQQNDVVTQEQLTTRILESSNAVDLQLRDIKGNQTNLVSAVEKMSAEMQSGLDTFVLDEVSQLLKLANNSALFSNDAEAAINALKLADIQLKELADPRFSVVRRQINQEITQLDNIPQVDIESITAKLSGLAAKVPSLPLENEPPAVDVVELTAAAEQNAAITWRGELDKIWKDVINSVQIQRVDQPPKPLLAPQQRYFLNQNLQLQLAKAELSLLQGRSKVYVQSLESSIAWLTDYFDLKDQQVSGVLAELNSLKAKPIKVELPSVAGSYDTLQSIKGGK